MSFGTGFTLGVLLSEDIKNKCPNEQMIDTILLLNKHNLIQACRGNKDSSSRCVDASIIVNRFIQNIDTPCAKEARDILNKLITSKD